MVVAQKRQIALREYSEATLGGAGLETVKTNLGKEKMKDLEMKEESKVTLAADGCWLPFPEYPIDRGSLDKH
jgi:hypothetical protein